MENNQEAYHCPSDRFIEMASDRESYFEQEGLSYEYQNRRAANKTRDQVRKSRDGEDRSSTRVWIVNDYEHFHGPKGEDGSRNFLYLDGHVDALIVADD
jgi:prepilin-type processing-associated H-X9-DG protein